jgi:hypothetical protein
MESANILGWMHESESSIIQVIEVQYADMTDKEKIADSQIISSAIYEKTTDLKQTAFSDPETHQAIHDYIVARIAYHLESDKKLGDQVGMAIVMKDQDVVDQLTNSVTLWFESQPHFSHFSQEKKIKIIQNVVEQERVKALSGGLSRDALNKSENLVFQAEGAIQDWLEAKLKENDLLQKVFPDEIQHAVNYIIGKCREPRVPYAIIAYATNAKSEKMNIANRIRMVVPKFVATQDLSNQLFALEKIARSRM